MKTPKVGTQVTPTPRTSRWRLLQTPGATIALNGGTVEDIAGGVRVTVPGGADTTSYELGTRIVAPMYYADGTRCRWGDPFMPRLRIRELAGGLAPGLSSDTLYGVGCTSDPTLATYTHIHGGHFTGGGRTSERSYRGTGGITSAFSAAVATMGGAELEVEVINETTSWLKTGTAYCIDTAGNRTGYLDKAALSWGPKPLTSDPLYWVILVRRSAPTAGAETIDIVADMWNPSPPR